MFYIFSLFQMIMFIISFSLKLTCEASICTVAGGTDSDNRTLSSADSELHKASHSIIFIISDLSQAKGGDSFIVKFRKFSLLSF
ncbi:hypothetical protein INR49_001344 [Caranx melampygus]|nr:hypothetical protein INR49_001344 [Caranx melampygus]